MASNGKIKKKRVAKQLKLEPAALPPAPPALARLNVISNSYSETTRERSTDDSWDRGNTHTSWSVEGLRLVDQEYSDVAADFEVKLGDTVYLVYAIYSTGDSFGHDSNSRIEYITVHKDRSIAELNEKVLNGKTLYSGKNNQMDWSVNLQTDSGIVIPYFVPWLGYFESLSGVHVESFVVEPRAS